MNLMNRQEEYDYRRQQIISHLISKYGLWQLDQMSEQDIEDLSHQEDLYYGEY